MICAWDLCGREAREGDDYCSDDHALLDAKAVDLVPLGEVWDAEAEAAADAGLVARRP